MNECKPSSTDEPQPASWLDCLACTVRIPVNYGPAFRKGWCPAFAIFTATVMLTIAGNTIFHNRQVGTVLHKAQAFAMEFPDVTIEGGLLTVDGEGPQTFVRDLPDEGKLIVDPDGTSERLESAEYGILFAEDRIIVKKQGGMITEHHYPETKTLDLSGGKLGEWIDTISSLSLPVIAVGNAIYVPLVKGIQAVAIAVVLILVVGARRQDLRFAHTMKAALLGLVPAILIDRALVWNGLSDTIPYLSGIYITVALTYAYVGLQNALKTEPG